MLNRLFLVKRAIVLGIVFSKLLSWNLWFSDRLFPLVPVFNIDPVPHPFDNLHFYAVLLVLMLIVVFPLNRKLLVCFFSLELLSCVQDQMRWQPWLFQYLLMLLPFLFLRKAHPEEAKQDLLNIQRLVILAVYFWSGVHKLNPAFITSTYTDMVTSLFHTEANHIPAFILKAGYVLPLIEMLIPIGLIFSRTRYLSVIAGTSMHLFILLYLGPLGINHNTVVWPWNLMMIFFLWILFFKSHSVIVPKRMKVVSSGIGLLVVVMPVMNFWNLWDSFLSFDLYSGKSQELLICIEDQAVSRLDKNYSAFFMNNTSLTGGKIIDVNDWAYRELNVPVYPENRVYAKICSSFCAFNFSRNELIFLIRQRPCSNHPFKKYDCETLDTMK